MTTFERTSVASWKRCNLCYDIVFKTPNEFSLHLRNNHCKKEGGSYVCCYGKNNVCGSLPLEGVSDQDYEFHVVKHHVLSLIGDDGSFQEENFVENLRQKYAHILTANEVHQQPNVVVNQCEWSVYSSTQNLPAVLNDPRRTKREWDLFTKTWGDGFTESACLPSCPYIPEINWIHFESYLKQTGKHFLRHSRQALKKTITDKKCISPVSKTGHPFVTKLSTISAEIEDVPKIFMQADFSLENPETFSQVLPWSQLYGQKSENSSRKNSVKLLQEKLSHYLDIVEVQIARQISMRSEAFFHAMTSHDALMDQLTHVIKCVCELRSKIHAIEDILVTGPMKIMRLKRTQGNFLHVYNKLKLMATVHQTQPTIQLLLSTSEFVGALDLIYTTQEVLSQELAGIHSFRHLSSQLAEIEKVIDKMMQTDFVRYVTADLNRPHQEGSFVMEEDRLVAILLGMLRKHQYTFIEIYRDECYTAVKTMVKQTIIEVISQADDILESNTGNLSEQLRSLNFSTWIHLLKQVFGNLNFLLKRIQALYQVMQETTDVAAGHFCSPTDSFHQWPAIQILDGENEVMVAEQDYMRVKANLKDLLCSVCEHAHECCGKLLSGRTRDGSLDKLTTSDFVLLAQGVESFQTSCEAICGKQGTSLRLALQSQANKFVNRFHEERKTKLSLILENEQWKQAEVPMEFQEIVNHIVSSGSLTLLKKNADDDPGERKPQKYLIVNSENYAVSGTVLLLLRMVIEYCQCVEDVPMLASDLGTRLLDLLKTFNSRTCQLVLGAGALQLVGLKTISIKHLALASRCLQLLVCFIPLAKEHFESRIHSKQQIITKHFEQTLKVYNEHIHEIQQKVECIIGDMFETQLRKWEVKAPVPSPCFNEISKQLNKVYELLHGLLPSEQIQKIFIIAHSTFKVKLRFHLARLHVNNDGGPKHGLVTQELTFYTQNLKKLNVPCNLNYNMNELWLHR